MEEKIATNSVHFLGHSYAVTLPKSWVDDVELTKDHTLEIFRKGDKLILQKGPKKESEKQS